MKGPSRAERAKRKSQNAFRKIGSYIRVRMEAVQEGDVISVPEGTFCIVRKEYSFKGSMMSVRNVVTRNVHRMRFEPMNWALKVTLESVLDQGRRWTITPGDVVMLMADRPKNATVVIRHARAWMPSAAPWLPMGDAEVLLELNEGRAKILRNSWRAADTGQSENFPLGTVVATKDRKDREPSVYLHKSPDLWVSNSRGANLSTAMIRYGLNRRTYEVLKPPEIG